MARREILTTQVLMDNLNKYDVVLADGPRRQLSGHSDAEYRIKCPQSTNISCVSRGTIRDRYPDEEV